MSNTEEMRKLLNLYENVSDYGRIRDEVENLSEDEIEDLSELAAASVPVSKNEILTMHVQGKIKFYTDMEQVVPIIDAYLNEARISFEKSIIKMPKRSEIGVKTYTYYLIDYNVKKLFNMSSQLNVILDKLYDIMQTNGGKLTLTTRRRGASMSRFTTYQFFGRDNKYFS